MPEPKAAKVKPIKPTGKKVAAMPQIPENIKIRYAAGSIHPGSKCKHADTGKKGKSRAGKV
ncbi:hypothetical protein CQ019_05745 [Arthrobacter sp. MYb229]|nr:hypothetical protein CIK76_12570 [Glutamicibacter sp. BW80]PRA06857.1 hypothetical protein CQ019_05745 [Arthrobacter sp. MYb229]PRB53759.1 hypothetical protein CQ013_05745 [Arthrobacter sp. MYb216]